MVSTALLLTSAVFSTGAQLYAQKSASAAGDEEMKYRDSLLTRKAQDQRTTVRENSRRQLLEKQRALSEIRVSQAARGFAASGTQLAVLGEFGSRIDEQIDNATTQGLGQVQQYNESARMARWGNKVRKSAERLDMATTLLRGATGAGSSLYSNYRNTGENPFGIFG